MSNKIILLFSHELTESQTIELKNKYNIKTVIYLPENLQQQWSNIHPDYIDIEEELLEGKNE